jgi:hypothetical protein
MSGELTQEGRLVPGSRSDLQYAFPSGQSGEAQVQGVGAWAGDGLAMTEREGDILVRTVPHRVRNEHVPGNRVESVQNRQVADPSSLQALDQAPPVSPVSRIDHPCIHDRTSLISL